MSYFIIQKNDIKAKLWTKSASSSDVELICQSGSPIKAPIFLLRTLLNRGRPIGYLLRYLNDYPSLLKTLIRFASEVLLISICRLLKIRVFWICHNLDRESTGYHQRVTALRRKLISNQADQIFVMDEKLVPEAKKFFPSKSNQIRSISFGRPMEHFDFDPRAEAEALSFLQRHRSAADERVLVAYCVGSISRKCLHFEKLLSLQEAARRSGFRLIAIVAGPFHASTIGREVSKSLSDNPDICFFANYMRFSDDFVRDNVDLYWRAYDDWSVPFTVYEAAALEKPILAYDAGFLPKMVYSYNLGQVIERDMHNVGEALHALASEFRQDAFAHFLDTHTWGSLPEQLPARGQI